VLHRNPASFDATLDLQSASHRLVVLQLHPASFDVGLDLEADRLVVVGCNLPGFEVRFDFHRCFLLVVMSTANIAAHLHIRRRGCESHHHRCNFFAPIAVIGAESERQQAVALPQTRSRVRPQQQICPAARQLTLRA